MKKFLICAALFSALCGSSYAAPGNNSFWRQVPEGSAPSKELLAFTPANYKVYTFNESWLKQQLFNLSASPADGFVIDLPLPDGSFRSFKVWQDPLMTDAMAAKYPEIKTFTATATDNASVTAKLDFTLYGFHAMIFDGENTSFIDPYDRFNDGFYMVHYRKDEVRQLTDRMKCEVKGEDGNGPAGESMDIMQKGLPKLAARTGNGWNLRTYRLALSTSHQYCQAATGSSTPTIAACLSAMTTSLNRINGVYEREFAVHMNFCANEDTLIWNVTSGGPNGADPFASINSNGSACLTKNQATCDARIGSANYDLGHVFTTGGGGISALGVVCASGSKARSVTGSPTPVGDGYDIDYVAHEMGHEFGSQHTFNNNADGSCSGNAVSNYAYEPGSGTTIMAYAGICNPDNLTMRSQDYFAASSLVQIYAKLSTSENTCAAITSTGNKLAFVPAFTASYTIPYKTPFELTAPTAVDSVADTATTYCWEQWNRGDFGKRFAATYLKGPIFRSYAPVKSQVRVFPRMGMVLAGVLSNAGSDGNQGEKVPDTSRYLTFKLTVRAILAGKGAFNFPDDTIHLDAVATPSKTGFKVTSQGSTGITYAGGSTQTITWDKVGTDAAPVNAATVDIYMSRDGGNTWPTLLGNFPNTGTAMVTIPNPASTTSVARIKVKGNNNVFFNVNSNNFTVTNNASLPAAIANTVKLAAEVKIFPVPASETVHITTGRNTELQAVVYNTIGQQ
ncbi:MAG: hypothetical protein H7257_05450, partial [Taibaiella sp.]|nr:hypothetical protein [Taibaiella sp.]